MNQGSVTNVTDHWVMINLKGSKIYDLLSKSSPYDFKNFKMKKGSVAQTLLNHTDVILHNIDDNNLNLFISLILATPIFTLIGSPIAALMLGSSLRGAALTFITLPFYLPIIIFGVMGTNINNSNINAEFYLLLAILSIGIIFFPMITVKILKNIIN